MNSQDKKKKRKKNKQKIQATCSSTQLGGSLACSVLTRTLTVRDNIEVYVKYILKVVTRV